jgi:dolichyl-phosphate beta-glucosyltransferase
MLSVVMPAYNEGELLADSVSTVAHALRARGEPFEIVVVENGSTDATSHIADELSRVVPELRVLHLAEADYGEALRSGLLDATGAIVATFDVDCYDLDFLDHARARIEGGSDLVLASKRATGARDERPPLRRAATALFSALVRAMLEVAATDTHGMKVMRRSSIEPVARACRLRTDLYDTELVVRAHRAGLAVVELPVVVDERRPPRTSLAGRVPRTLRGLFRLRRLLAAERAVSAPRP